MNSEQKNNTKSYRDLLVWQKSVTLATETYKLTRKFPKSELFALTSQVQRAVVSVSANIAEGYGRHSPKEFAHLLRIAHGSLTELETLLTIAQNVSYCSPDECSTIETQMNEIGGMLYGLRKKLQ